jgi:cobalt-zinc-cadmium efflux system membrane fusion protein
VVEGTSTVPATVTSNAYRETKINSLVGGIVRHVYPELGVQVARGETLVVVFSQELAEAQMKYLSMQAMLQADHQKLTRTRKLAEIGAASRQEVEEVTAVHEAHATEVAAARQRLLLLGLTATQVDRLQDASHIVSEVAVTSPADGTILARNVNPGQVVGAGHELLTVADLRTVWVIGDLYEKDFAAVRVGTPATIVVPAAAGMTLRGRVAYIDPRVEPATRTAKVRVEVPNREGVLRLGMFVQMTFRVTFGERRALVPRAAVQSIGSRTVVYVATEDEGRFVETTVTLGPSAGDAVQVLAGVKPGDRVVTEGSFFLRAEAARVRSSG